MSCNYVPVFLSLCLSFFFSLSGGLWAFQLPWVLRFNQGLKVNVAADLEPNPPRVVTFIDGVLWWLASSTQPPRHPIVFVSFSTEVETVGICSRMIFFYFEYIFFLNNARCYSLFVFAGVLSSPEITCCIRREDKASKKKTTNVSSPFSGQIALSKRAMCHGGVMVLTLFTPLSLAKVPQRDLSAV